MSTDWLKILLYAVNDLRITNAVTIASLLVLVYDIILTLPDEIEYVWNADWTYGKALFFLNRYPVVIVSAFVIASNMDVASDYKMCEIAILLEGWSMLVFIIPVQLIFCLRTAALWERDRKVISFLLLLMIACDAIVGVFIWRTENLSPSSIPQQTKSALQAYIGCYAIIMNRSSLKNSIPSVAAIMVFDAVILVLTVWRFIRIRTERSGSGSVLRILFRDGMIYYVVVFASSLVNLITYALVSPQHSALATAALPILRTMMSMCASRMMLNLRGVVESARSGSWITGGGRESWARVRERELVQCLGSRSEWKMAEGGGEVRGEDNEGDSMEMSPRLHIQPGLGLGLGLGLGYRYEQELTPIGPQPPIPSPALHALRPGTAHVLARPRSTTVVEVVTGPPSSSAGVERRTVVEGGAMFNIVRSVRYDEEAGECYSPMGCAV